MVLNLEEEGLPIYEEELLDIEVDLMVQIDKIQIKDTMLLRDIILSRTYFC